MRDHDLIEELLAARALGGLEPEDGAVLQVEMAAHGADCAECRGLETELDEVAGRLAFVLEPVPVPSGMEDELVENALYEGEPVATVPPDGRRLKAPRGSRPVGVRLRPLVAIAASLVLFAGGWVIGGAFGGGDEGVPAGARVVAFEGAQGELSVAYAPGEPGVYILGSGLEAPPEGKVYEVWMIEGGTPTPGPCVRPSADGSLFTFVDAELGSTDTMAVTVEPETCSTTPTSDPIFVASIATA